MMEIRMRSAVSRTAKGYSVEATLDISQSDDPVILKDTDIMIQQSRGRHTFGETGAPEDIVDSLSAFQITKLKEHLKALDDAFPRYEAAPPVAEE